jgi:hypothetical protein
MAEQLFTLKMDEWGEGYGIKDKGKGTRGWDIGYKLEGK